jgi:hypothetical protein
MPRTNILVRAVAAVLVIAAILVPAAFAKPNAGQRDKAPIYWSYGYQPPVKQHWGTTHTSPARDKAPVYWSYDYQAPIPHAGTAQAVKADTGADHTGVTIAVVLAGACLLLGAVTVLPRRHRVAV